MSKQEKHKSHDPPRPSTEETRDDGAMSPTMRQLILSFGVGESDRTWNPGAYSRRSSQTAVRSGGC